MHRYNTTPLIVAPHEGHLDCVEFLVVQGTCVDKQTMMATRHFWLRPLDGICSA